jgi:lipoprotein-anchoring transpeptidase ErfK/SrfK
LKPIVAAPGIRRNVLVLALGALLLMVTACGGGGQSNGGSDAKGGTSDGKAGASDTVASAATVTILPKDGATDVSTTGTLRVTAEGGRLSSVVVKDGKGTPVDGAISTDGTGWEPTGHLDTSTQYSVDAVAKDSAGRESDKHSSFTTVTPKNTFIGYFTPEDGSTVGVGMEVHLDFNRPITDKKAVENGVKVTANPSVPVAAHWYGDQQLYIRPQEYWAAGTKVTLSLNLDGVEGAPGVYGKQHKDVHFTVGRRQVSIVDAARHTMTVYRDNKVLRTLPISSGAPEHTTYNGKMVISEKYIKTRMNGDTVGFGGEYDIKDVPHAMRLTSSGTFVHGNYWSPAGVFGTTNVSHGCIGLRDIKGGGPGTPAGWFFTHSLIGDPIRVVHSHDRTVAADNGMGGWNLDWAQWRAGSAL